MHDLSLQHWLSCCLCCHEWVFGQFWLPGDRVGSEAVVFINFQLLTFDV